MGSPQIAKLWIAVKVPIALSNFLFIFLFLLTLQHIFASTAQAQTAETGTMLTEEGTLSVSTLSEGMLDAERFVAQRWVRINFDPLASTTHTLRVSWGNEADVRFRVFNADGTPISSVVQGTNPGIWVGNLNANDSYYIGLWSAAGITNYVATLETSEPVSMSTFGEGMLDADRNVAQRWVRLNVDPLASATHTLRVLWDNEADVRFRVFNSDGTPISSVVQGTNPGIWVGDLDANDSYYIGLWSAEGITNYVATLSANDVSNNTLELEQVIDYGTADFTAVLGQRHNVVGFSPQESGPITIELAWDGNQKMNLAVFDSVTNQRLAADATTGGSPKSLTLNLISGRQYRATFWIDAGTADWVLRKIQNVADPDNNISNAPDNAERPNIVLINTDDQRASTLRFLPAIQEHLIEKGMRFENTIVPTPSCCPSRATTLTGRYVHNNGQFQQQLSNESIFENTIQKYLKQAGYFTGHAGKYLHWLDQTDPVPPYWDRWTYIKGGFYDVDMNFDGQYLKPGGYTTDIVFERTKDYLREFETQDDDNPWFVYIAPMSPHRPYTAEYDFRDAIVPELELRSLAYLEADLSDKPDFLRFRQMDNAEARDVHQQRARNLLSLDREVDQLMDYLEASGEIDNTLIIFTSDNGYILGEHQTYGKFTPYRDSVEVPMVIRWQGRVAENTQSQSYVSHVDIAPTILDAAGVETSSLLLDGRNIFDESRDTFYMEYFLDRASNGGRIGDWASLRTEVYQYTEWYSDNAAKTVIFREYYDMVNDPYQLENLYMNGDTTDDPDYGPLSFALQNARTCVGDACP